MRRPILNNSLFGDLVYEPFAGSGSTIIAAHSVGRFCYAMELSPQYCDVIMERFETLTGEKATRAE
jgi:DNA modification methylase